LAPLILNNQWILDKGDESLEMLNLKLNTAEKYIYLEKFSNL
jgi:hypothetical protein